MEFTNEKAKELLDVGTAQAQELMKNPPKVDELLVSLEEKLKEVMYQMIDIKSSVYALYQDGEYDEDYLDDIIEELDNATDAIRGAQTLM